MSKTPEDLLNKAEFVFSIERGQNHATIRSATISQIETLKDPRRFAFKLKTEKKDPTEENVVPFKDVKKR